MAMRFYDIRSKTSPPTGYGRSKPNRAVREHTAPMARPRANIDTAALADAFAPDGLHGTSSTALAAAAGLAKPTLYVHGRSKEALFLRAVEAEVERVLDRLHGADSPVAAAQALLAHAAARPLGAQLLNHTARHDSSAVAPAVQAALR